MPETGTLHEVQRTRTSGAGSSEVPKEPPFATTPYRMRSATPEEILAGGGVQNRFDTVVSVPFDTAGIPENGFFKDADGRQYRIVGVQRGDYRAGVQIRVREVA